MPDGTLLCKCVSPTLYNNGPEYTDRDLRYQLMHWQSAEEPHPANDDEAFHKAQRLAREKVIIPWQADILDPESMQWLADNLRNRQSSVTFMNLTNLLPCLRPDSFDMAYRNLKALPTTAEAPILATGASILIRPRSFEEADLQAEVGPTNHDVGPFFGLDNLRRAYKQYNGRELGAIEARDYLYSERCSGSQDPIEQLLMAALSIFLEADNSMAAQ